MKSAPASAFPASSPCNFIVNGGSAIWQLGEKNGRALRITTDGRDITLQAGDEMLASAVIPDLGREGRIHTLRIECNQDIFYASIDGIRLLTLENPGFTAREIGAVKNEGAAYSFLACTAHALGSSDTQAVKALPGAFHAIHALEDSEITPVSIGKREEMAAAITRAAYPVRIGQENTYWFDLTVSPESAGKALSLSLDGEKLLDVVIPAWEGKKTDTFTFTTAPVALPEGAHTLEVAGDGAILHKISAFMQQETQAFESDFSKKAFRQTYYTMGNFNQKNAESILTIRANKGGMALFGEEGNADYEMYVRFSIPVEGLGSSGIVLRVTDASWYLAQLLDCYFGYSISLSKLGLYVRRIRYGATGTTDFASIPAWKNGGEGELIIRAEGERIALSLPDGTELCAFQDAQPFTHGKFGFFSTGKELTVLEFNVKPLN